MLLRRFARVPPPSLPVGQGGTPEWSDRELVRALELGDPRAGLLLYDRLIRIVEWTILRITGQRSSEHEDLVQMAFEQIVVTLHRQRYAHRCSLTSWASAVSSHVALNALRSQRRRRVSVAESADGLPEPRASGDLEDQLAARQVLERIRHELARMNPARARALVLHEINGLELSEIAGVLGISVVAAQSRLSRGRRELIERLSSDVGGRPDD
ncbi:MAG TPA: RNA polymerase sigma factor [Polyangiaceae bacterium]|nr:RNA polymerase sigma factor [Polyangiaceae bacterium]